MSRVTRSKKKVVSKTMKRNNKALSISGIRNSFKEMDKAVRLFIKANRFNSPSVLEKYVSRQWISLFTKPLSSEATSSLAQHYMNLHGKKGGSAPLDYEMRPGLPAVATYATFPTEIGTDPNSVKALDVYYNSGLSRSCGNENTSATVPASMGSNEVPNAIKGGAFRTTYSDNQQIFPSTGGKRKTKRNKRGGTILTSLNAGRFYSASNPAGILQTSSESWAGQPIHKSDISDPTSQGWELMSKPYVGPLPTPSSQIASASTLAVVRPAFYTPPPSNLF
jgi:hypothetical protein